MYTLRIIEETRENEKAPFEQIIGNYELGCSYSKIEREMSKEFDQIIKNYPDYKKEEIRSIICGENEREYFIMKNGTNINHSYFIMTDSGKTFEKL